MSQKSINDFFKKKNSVKTPLLQKPPQKTLEYTLYFDGASRSNPGPASYGGVIYAKESGSNVKQEVGVYYKYIGKETNNEAEYMGALKGIRKAISLNIRDLKVFGDSNLIIQQIKGAWKVKSANLKPIYNEIKGLLHHFDTIEFSHVYRKNNKRADELANIALDKHLG